MYIELIRKSTHWYGSEGVVLDIRVTLTTDSGRRVIDIQVVGINEPLTTMTTTDKYFTIPNMAIHVWLRVKGYMWGWEVEVTKYKAALSKVDLPYPPRYVKQSYLSYRLTVGDGIYLVLAVQDGSSYLDVYVGGDEDDGDFIGSYTIAGAINMGTVRGIPHPIQVWYDNGSPASYSISGSSDVDFGRWVSNLVGIESLLAAIPALISELIEGSLRVRARRECGICYYGTEYYPDGDGGYCGMGLAGDGNCSHYVGPAPEEVQECWEI
jgi:hypothetical protein